MKIRRLIENALAVGALATLVTACSDDSSESADPTAGGPAAGAVTGKKSGTKADAWNARNNPEKFASFIGESLEYQLDKLPMAGQSDHPSWPASYWPTYEDSTNYRWRGPTELSPLEKYDLAFNDWQMPAGFMDLRPLDTSNCEDGWDKEYYQSLGPAAKYMSDKKGNLKARNGKDDNDNDEIDECGGSSYDGVETWFGLCHAWAPAATLEPEPKFVVNYNGIEFYPSDIKALLLTIYDSSNSTLIGGRCNDKDVERDENGRITDPDCRDINAGTFHVIFTNMLGILNMPFVEDRTYDYQVWNQPVDAYEITSMEEVDEAKAIGLLNREDESYPFNEKAETFFDVSMTVTYITESSASEQPIGDSRSRYFRTDKYRYLLEVDGEGKVIGGEWLTRTAEHPTWGISDQPDFLWVATGPNTSGWSRANPHVDYAKVKELLTLSQSPGGGDESGEADRLEFAADDTPVAIPDDDPAGAHSTLVIDDTTVAKKLYVQVDISHTYRGDLIVTVSRDGDAAFEQVLHNATGGSEDDLNITTEITGAAGTAINGTYKLSIEDTYAQDEGKLVSWKVLVEE